MNPWRGVMVMVVVGLTTVLVAWALYALFVHFAIRDSDGSP